MPLKIIGLQNIRDRIPLLGIADFNPHGLGVLQCYRRGSVRSAIEGCRFGMSSSSMCDWNESKSVVANQAARHLSDRSVQGALAGASVVTHRKQRFYRSMRRGINNAGQITIEQS